MHVSGSGSRTPADPETALTSHVYEWRDSEFADVADPARDFFALGAAFVEVMIARAQDHAGDAGQQREIFLHDDDLGAEI